MALELKDIEKVITDKLVGLKDDVKTSTLDAVHEEVKKQLDGMAKERDFHSGFGTDPTQTWDEVNVWGVPKGYQSKSYFDTKGIYHQDELLANRMGSFYSAAWRIQNRVTGATKNSPALSDAVIKALGENTGSTGGFMVPVEFRPELLRLIIEDQVVRPRATVVPMATDQLWWPKIVDTSHVSGIHGGMKGTPTAEAGTLGTGDPVFGQLRLIPTKYTNYIPISNELLMDSPISIAPLIGMLGREAVGFSEDYDALFGAGPNTLLGVMKSGSLQSVVRTSSGQILWDDIRNMYGTMFPSSYKRAVWVCSPSALMQIMNMSIAVGTGGNGVFIANIPGQTAADNVPMRILGQPLIVSEKMSAVGTVGDLIFADFSYYIIGDRMDLTIDASEHYLFGTDQTAFRLAERLAGAPWIDSALTAKNGSDILTAFVALSTV